MKARVNNIVATANLSTSIYLPCVIAKFPFCEYNQKKFAAMTVRFNWPTTTCLIFGSGRIVCTGASSMMSCRLAVTEVWKMVVESGYTNASLCDFRIQNIVANFDFGAVLDLNILYRTFPNEANFSPELFPGLIMRFADTKVVYLVFESGKAVITGSQSMEEVACKSDHLDTILSTTYGESAND